MTDDQLVARATEARTHAYAPYSRYQVGCAVLAGDQVFTGANIENVSYGAVLCAERVAVTLAAYHGVRSIDTVALITTSRPPAAPCGLCRQTLLEFAPDPARVRILIANTAGERIDTTLAELMPLGFRRQALDTAD